MPAQQGNAEPQNPSGPANRKIRPKQHWPQIYHTVALATIPSNLANLAGDVGAFGSQLFQSARESNHTDRGEERGPVTGSLGPESPAPTCLKLPLLRGRSAESRAGAGSLGSRAQRKEAPLSRP